MLTRTIFIYSVTYKVNLFDKAFAHVRNCLWKEQHMYGTNQNIDGFYTKTTQISDLFTTMFSPYLLRFFTVNYALRLNLTSTLEQTSFFQNSFVPQNP
jgi:hypothetical protein